MQYQNFNLHTARQKNCNYVEIWDFTNRRVFRSFCFLKFGLENKINRIYHLRDCSNSF